MKLKLDEKGNAIIQEGHPVYIFDDGKEAPFDADHAMKKISALNGEAKAHRERAEKAESDLKVFEGLDPEQAKSAIDMVSKLDSKKLIDAGEVDKVKAGIEASYQSQIAELKKAIETEKTSRESTVAEKDGMIYNLMVSNRFGTSKFVTDNVAIPPDMVQAAFGKNFKVEGDRVVGYNASGNQIFSTSKPGELADFDEALEHMINEYPHKDRILRPQQSPGSGFRGQNPAGNRQQVDTSKLSPVEKIRFAREQNSRN